MQIIFIEIIEKMFWQIFTEVKIFLEETPTFARVKHTKVASFGVGLRTFASKSIFQL